MDWFYITIIIIWIVCGVVLIILGNNDSMLGALLITIMMGIGKLILYTMKTGWVTP